MVITPLSLSPYYLLSDCSTTSLIGLEEAVDHSTRFAKSLGFFEDAAWSLNSPASALREIEDSMQVDELASQDKRQYLEDSGRLSYLSEDD